MQAIRQQITIDVSSRAVWAALTTEDGLAAWWGETARIDAREGGRIVVTRTVGEDSVELRGIFHKLRPTRDIEIAWDNVGSSPWRGTRLNFQVGRGDETKVHVVQSIGEGLEDEEAYAAEEAFWKAALLRLRETLEG